MSDKVLLASYRAELDRMHDAITEQDALILRAIKFIEWLPLHVDFDYTAEAYDVRGWMHNLLAALKGGAVPR